MDKITLFIIAGEISGDVHAANIVRELQKSYDVHLYGTGGPNLLSLGQKQYASVDDLAVIGFDQAIRKIPMLLRLAKEIEKGVQEHRPDLILTVDYNGFNLRLGKRLRKYKIPLVQFVSPHFWVYGYSRVYTMRDYFDKVLCILPFEAAQLQKENVNAVYIGNPVTDGIKFKYDSKEEFLTAAGLDTDKLTIGLIPGSRPHEIANMMPVMADAARRLGNNNVQYVLARADAVKNEQLSPHLDGLDVKVLSGQTHDVMKYSDILWICSGTATLEAGIIGTPMIILYKTSAFNLFIAHRLTKLRMFGMPNIIAGRYVVPELLNKTMDATHLLQEHEQMLPRLDEYREALKPLTDVFAGMTPIKNAAEEIIKSIKDKNPTG